MVDHRPQVQPGAADEHGVTATTRDVLQGPPGRDLEVGHGKVLVGLDQVEQMMRARRPGPTASGFEVPMSMPR